MTQAKKKADRGRDGPAAVPHGLLGRLARAGRLRGLIPTPLKQFGRRFIDRDTYQRYLWRLNDPYADAEEVSTYPPKVDVRLGIIKEFAHHHRYFIGACRDLGVPYRLLDISGPDWIEVVQDSGCDAFLVRPPAYLTIWKQMFDERLRVMVQELGKVIYPTHEEIWLYESKRRMHYWLRANDIPQPRTWVFYSRDQALSFACTAELPIVYKSDLGAGASGVRIFRDRGALTRFVKRCFEKGIVRKDGDRRDRQWGTVLLQEYLPEITEWRMIRLGESYFGHQKLKKGEFHSGSERVGWYDPPKKLLDFTRQVTEVGRFTSMGLDVFETRDGRYLVNELQSLFGSYRPYQMLVEDKPGRYLFDKGSGTWHFEEGIFCQNGSCNLRVQAVVDLLARNSGR